MTITTRMILLAAAAALLAGADAPSELTPTQAEAMLDHYGPPGPAWPRFDDVQQSIILHGVESGDARWLALLPRLRKGGDAGFAELLPMAVSEALKARPANVLRILGAPYPAERICGDIEIEPSAAELRAYYSRTIPAVQAVLVPELKKLRDSCLANLRYKEKYELANPMR